MSLINILRNYTSLIVLPNGLATFKMFWGNPNDIFPLFLTDKSANNCSDDENEYEKRKNISPKLVEAMAAAMPNNVRSAYKSLDAAAMILRIARSLDARISDPKLDCFFEELQSLQREEAYHVPFAHKKVIVIEGLSGSGKTTLANHLASSFGAIAITSAPDIILQVHDVFSIMPEPIARAFEHISNYFIARAIRNSNSNVVLVERYYHAICAHETCADCGSIQDLQSLPSSAFSWPIDLMQPSIVIFLAISTEIRMRRQRLGGGTSASERSYERTIAKDNKAQTAYSMITGPPTVGIDASGAPDEVLELCLQACETYGVPLRLPPVSASIPMDSNRRISMGVYGVLSGMNW